jgi:hypothetical protein
MFMASESGVAGMKGSFQKNGSAVEEDWWEERLRNRTCQETVRCSPTAAATPVKVTVY